MVWGFQTCGPNEAIIVSGCCHSRPLMVPGGRAFVWPWIQKVQRISLNSMTLVIESPRVYSQQGVPISVTGIAQVKIQGGNADMLRAACEQFLGKTEEEIMDVAKQTLEGHQRAIMASMTVEDIYKNRKKFSKKVFEVASSDLVDMGFTVISYTIKDISDEEGYLKALGEARTAEVKRDARIGEAVAKKESMEEEAKAEEAAKIARYENEREVAVAQKDFEAKKAEIDEEVFRQRAQADKAGEHQGAKTRKAIMRATMEILKIEREKDAEIEEAECARKRFELQATVEKPADAEKERMRILAEANAERLRLEAEAEAEAVKITSAAEAYAIEVKAKAEAESIARKADAFRQFEEASKVEMILESLPKIAAEVAAPLTNLNRVVMVSQGDGEIGASKLTGEILDIVNKINQTTTSLTGKSVSLGPGGGLAIRR